MSQSLAAPACALPVARSQVSANCASIAAAICPLFDRLPKAVLDAMTQRAQARYFATGDRLARGGEAVVDLFVIVEGLLTVWTPGLQRGGPLRILRRGDLCCDLALFGDMPQSTDVKAITNGTLLALDGRDVRQAVREHPELAARVIRYLCGQTRSFEQEIQVNQSRDALGKLASMLLMLSTLRNPPSVYVSQGILAELVGVRRETVSRILQQWKLAGLVEMAGRRITPQSIPRLTKIAAVSAEGPC